VLEAAGYIVVPWGQPAALCIVNSCTVTTKADRDTRRLVRFAKRLNPDAVVVVTGCYVDVARQVLADIPEIDLLVPNRDKHRLLELLRAIDTSLPTDTCRDLPYGVYGPLITRFSTHTRAFVKIQEGCDSRCTYCIIPSARGPARSVFRDDVLRQVRLLADQGHSEIVLIGTHLGRYGADLDADGDLTSLIHALVDLPSVGRLRLSSIEPQEITPGIVELLADGGRALDPRAEMLAGYGKLCRHLHVPLQSGCDEILRAMGRPYDTAFYAALVWDLVTRVPGLCLGADVIAGFPGETDELFARTEAFIRSLPLSYLHVFSYSPRPGTLAAELPGQVSPEVRKARTRTLRAISDAKLAAFVEAQVGGQLEVVPERRAPDGRLYSLADNYVRVSHDGPEAILGKLVCVEVTAACGNLAWGESWAETESPAPDETDD